MDIRCQIHKSRRGERGVTAIHLLVILVPALFALVGFAVDLGILYSIKGELKSGANSMALAAASQLIGTDASAGAANSAALATIETGSGFGNKYYFNGMAIGGSDGTLSSTVTGPTFYATLADALASGTTGGAAVGGALGRHTRVTLTGQTRLLFWSFIPIVSDRTVSVLATAVAGMSPPLCLACGIEPYAVAAVSISDTTDFGFVPGTKYSFAYLCTGAPLPAILPGASQSLTYILLNRLDPNAVIFPDEASQAYRDLAGGLPGNTNSAQACFRVNNTEILWADAAPNTCTTDSVAPVVIDALCGLDTRFESTPPAVCASIPGLDVLSAIYPPDTDVNDYDTYTDYTGDGRRIITIPIVDALGTSSMTVLGFRQFLLIPDQGASDLNPADNFGRFVAMYIGSVAPVKQGRFDGCQQTAGPGKVVLQQ